jgi:hypothetical protein
MQKRTGGAGEQSKVVKGLNSVVHVFRLMGTIAKESFTHPRGSSTITYNPQTREIKATTEPPQRKP